MRNPDFLTSFIWKRQDACESRDKGKNKRKRTILTDKLEIKYDLRSKYFSGRYEKNLIRIRPGMSETQRNLTIRHELCHHKFYTKNPVGRFLMFFWDWKLMSVYSALVFVCWVFTPSFYPLACLPIFGVATHECVTSIKFPARLSFTFSMLEILSLLAFLFVRFWLF